MCFFTAENAESFDKLRMTAQRFAEKAKKGSVEIQDFLFWVSTGIYVDLTPSLPKNRDRLSPCPSTTLRVTGEESLCVKY